ncbi:phosphoinositide 3-kinase adapter protein 1-like [Wyeomyia smithii]|uniref:phosphoinositide 3-kinase adapter protein 1-like n=1 Tax=Wyeomyia smithii TaxID=174621 RepID=UPI0024680BD5|nr:phosphoinositide 3-kinase adapter protein 1-like [Wyeomyia smithii]
MEENTMLSDNPAYFDEQVTAKSGDTNKRGFIFRKRNSTGKFHFARQANSEHKQPPAHKQRAGLEGFQRYRSNSATLSRIKPFTLPEYSNTNNDCSVNRRDKHCRERQITNCDDSSSAKTRRHSIRTFNRKEQLQPAEISDEVPNMLAPKAPVGLVGASTHSLTSMEDIVFITTRHNEQAFMWVNHLKTCFDKITKQRGKLPFKFLHVTIDRNQFEHQLVQRCRSTKLQIVIICPAMFTLSPQYLRSTFELLLKPEKVLGVLLNVTETHVFESHKDTLPGFKKWRICFEGDSKQSFLSELLGIAMDILGSALRQQPHCSDQKIILPNEAPAEPHESFTLFPRKVKIGHNKVLAVFIQPLNKTDRIKIKIEKANYVIEIINIKRKNPYTVQFSIPDYCMEISTIIGIRVERNSINIGCRPLKCESQFRELEQILRRQNTPMEFLCQVVGIPALDREQLDLRLFKAFENTVPKHFHLLNELDSAKKWKTHREANPEKYPSLLHFAAYWGLERLCLRLLECPGADIVCEMRNKFGRTPGDLAELGGHYSVADIIKKLSRREEFSTMYHCFKGISDLSPNKVVIEPKSASIEQQHQQNPGYIEMNFSGSDVESIDNDMLNLVTNLNYLMVDTIHEIQEELASSPNTEKDQEIVNNLNDDYREHDISQHELKIAEFQNVVSNDNSKNDLFSQECSKLLENSNDCLSNDKNNAMQPSHSVDLESNYLVQPSNIPFSECNSANSPIVYQQIPNNVQLNNTSDAENEISHLRLSFRGREQMLETKPKIASSCMQEINRFHKTVDVELLELFTDFKNNVFTIQEVEQLVHAWKSRNDVQQSFIEKQEQLEMMRQEYERIQQQNKEKLKRSNPYETMKKIFSRNKNSDSKKERDFSSGSSRNVYEDSKASMQQSRRHITLSSVHSSSSNSSGRISNLSGSSSNGMHSDAEGPSYGSPITSDNNVAEQDKRLENYMIPPVPRPVILIQKSPQIENTQRITSINADEHYTIFPSNVPVIENDLK